MRYRVHQAGLPDAGPPLGLGIFRRWAGYLGQPARILRSYRREFVTPDVIAGLTVAMVALPQAIAYASIADLPPHFGLYAAIVAAIVGSLWGSSHHLSTGPTNAASILMLSVLAPMVALGTPEYLVAASVMALLVGGFRILFGFAGLGVLINFVSRAVLVGFTAGAAILIAVNQLPTLLGLHTGPSRGTFATLGQVHRHLADTNTAALTIGLGVAALTLVVNRFLPRLPGALIALITASAVVGWRGAEHLGVAVVGDLPSPLPQLTDVQAATSFFTSGLAGEMLTGALAISLLGLVEAISIARTISRSSGQRLDVNQEFVGQGLSNIATGLLGGYPCSGSFTRSAVNYQAGAKTQMAGVFCGLALIVAVLLTAPYLASLPRTAVAGVILLVAYGMIDHRTIRRILRTSREEAAVMGLTFAVTIAFPLEFAVLSGVIFSLAMYVYRSSLPAVFPVTPDATFRHLIAGAEIHHCPQIAVMNIRGSLYFGATQHVEDVLLQNLAHNPEQRYLLLRMHGVSECDFTGIEMLEGLVRTYRNLDGDVFMVRVRRTVRETMRQSGFDTFLGEDHFLAQEEAIDYLFETVVDPARCWYQCEHRVFAECQALTKNPIDIDLPHMKYTPIDPARRLDPGQVQELIAERRPIVIDVREPDEYHHGHFPEARLLPLSNLLTSQPDLPRDRPILLICRTGRRSKRAMRFLMDLGYSDLQNLKGGILSWKALDLPLEVD